MSNEAELPGESVNFEQLQMIICRYMSASHYIAGKRVLEVGCGAGLGLGILAGSAREVVAGDKSESNVKLARQHYGERIKLVTLDAHKLPFAAGSIDVILAMEIIQYLDLPVFLAECRRVLKTGGVLLLGAPNPEAHGFHPSHLSQRYFTVHETAQVLAQQGFSAEISGAFAITRPSLLEDLRGKLIILVSRLLDIVPGGSGVKRYLNRAVIGRTIMLPKELSPEDADAGYMELTPLPPAEPDRRYRIIYTVARAR